MAHILAKVANPGGLGARADMRSCFRSRVSQANCRDIGGRYRLRGLGAATKYQSTMRATDELHIWRVLTNTSAKLYHARRGDEPGNGRVKVRKGEKGEETKMAQ